MGIAVQSFVIYESKERNVDTAVAVLLELAREKENSAAGHFSL
jgi:hypothetical protein